MAEYCPYCMRPSSGKYCPFCGREVDFLGKEFLLPVGTHLMGTDTPYMLGASIGQGGFGVTYAAMNCASGERVAIKEYFPTFWSERSENGRDVIPKSTSVSVYEHGRRKFLEEAETIEKLKYLKSIVNVRDFFRANNTAYIVMEYLEGETLAQMVKRRGKLTWEELQPVLRPLMEDIDSMHVMDVLHRDIAPDNIMVMQNGSLKLMDFGSARSFQKTPTGKTQFIKPGFSPAEQYQREGSQGPFTDVYSMAASIYCCLCGKTPAQAPDRLSEIANGHADPLKSLQDMGVAIPHSAEAAIRRAMAVYIQTRTKSMREFCDQLYHDVRAEIRLAFQPLQRSEDNQFLRISWQGSRPGGTSYFLLRRVNDGKYKVIEIGNQKVYTDRVPASANTIQYRLELRDGRDKVLGSCESLPIKLDKARPIPLQQRQFLLPLLAVAAGVLLGVLAALLIKML